MGAYFNNNGVLEPLAGRGKAEYGASALRKGTLTIPVDRVTGEIFIEFDTPLPDDDYIVSWEFDDCADGDAAHIVGPHYKYATGFGLYYFGGFTKDVIIRWTAFKLYTDNEYNSILTKMPELLSGRTTILTSSDDIDALNTVGTYAWNSYSIPANVPDDIAYGIMLHFKGAANGANEQQYLFKGSAGIIYIRSLATTNPRTWGTWHKFYAANDEYSTSEKVVGTWIDGKPIYRKVVTNLNMPNGSASSIKTATTAHNISNMGDLVGIKVICKVIGGSGGWTLNYKDSTSYELVSVTNANITIQSDSNMTGYTGFAVVEYTKATD